MRVVEPLDRELGRTATFRVGLVLDTSAHTRRIDMGPPAETNGVAAFRDFWGPRAELRRFADGSIREAVLWECDPGLESSIVGQIVRYAIERARDEGLAYLFSCTTSEKVEGFFERHGFQRVEPQSVPKAKWDDYDPARRSRVRCLRFDLR